MFKSIAYYYVLKAPKPRRGEFTFKQTKLSEYFRRAYCFTFSLFTEDHELRYAHN